MANKNIYTAAIALALLASCNELDDDIAVGSNAVELTGIETIIGDMQGTRANTMSIGTAGYVGRQFFVNKDEMMITKFFRTENTIATYSYKDIAYQSNENGAWKKTSSLYDYIYWTDNANPHTMVGYSCPQGWTDGKWNAESDGDNIIYKGYLAHQDNVVDFSDSTKLAAEDLLLTYSDTIQAEPGGSVAVLHYKHALSSVRVVVNIQNFASNDQSQDIRTKVFDLSLLNQPWKYGWAQRPVPAEGNRIAAPGWGTQDYTRPEDGTVSIKTWLRDPEGNNSNRNKTFTFRSLVVPGRQDEFKVEFTVRYPMALNPDEMEEKTYTATINHSGTPGQSDYREGVYFEPGKCTTVNISLNHKDESITIGAEYIDWEDVDTPSNTNLAKYSTFLGTTRRDSVTIATDDKATIDDATWLYYNRDNTLVDIYGNDGSEAKPFVIKTAYQFLSFAHEVNNGRDFAGLNVKLDASLVLQSSTDFSTSITNAKTQWIGIGTAANPFNGTFIGTTRYIRYLKGAPLFTHIGSQGKVEGLTLEYALGVTSGGILADINEGIICGCLAKINTVTSFTQGGYSGLCGTNNGTIAACGVTGPDYVPAAKAGICASNTGTVIACYAGIPLTSEADIANGGTVTCCYFDKNRGGNPASANAMITEDMQNNGFVYTLNAALRNASDTHVQSHSFTFRMADYPKPN